MRILRTLACAVAVAVGTLFAAAGAYAQSPLGAPLFAVLNGGNECVVPGPVCRKGDLDAIGSATIIFPTTTSVCWAITANNLKGATLAHIHRGTSGVNGGIAVVLTPPNPPGAGTPGASSGCKAGIAAGTISAIRADPTSFYVNVHNRDFPDGAVRGQLH
jgi:hypothetical protein